MSIRKRIANTDYQSLSGKIGAKFKQYRLKSGLSLRDIYRDEQISIALISDLEAGKKLPRMETLVRLCNKVGMPLDEVFSSRIAPSRVDLIAGEQSIEDKIRTILLSDNIPTSLADELVKYFEFLKTKENL